MDGRTDGMGDSNSPQPNWLAGAKKLLSRWVKKNNNAHTGITSLQYICRLTWHKHCKGLSDRVPVLRHSHLLMKSRILSEYVSLSLSPCSV